jgi:phosphoribosylformimino-5-aminoimidazole carboxamide ribonucleotide (ProFAR) isomerase
MTSCLRYTIILQRFSLFHYAVIITIYVTAWLMFLHTRIHTHTHMTSWLRHTVIFAALGEWSPIACTYAGGGKHISDLRLVDELSTGRVDLTFGRYDKHRQL